MRSESTHDDSLATELDRADRARLAAQIAYGAAERRVFGAITRAIGPDGFDDDEVANMPDAGARLDWLFAESDLGHGPDHLSRRDVAGPRRGLDRGCGRLSSWHL